MPTEKIVVPAIRHTFGWLEVDDLISWAWKGAAENTDSAVIQAFKMIAEQFERVRDA